MPPKSSEPRGGTPTEVGALLSIGDVAVATGIGVDTMRAWERRYGRPRATRLPSGHRRYTAEQVVWLRRVAEGLARGHRPSHLLSLDEDALTAVLEEPVSSVDETTALLLEHVRAYRRAEIVTVMERDWRALAPQRFLEERIVPLLDAVGRLWADGGLEIRHEHFLTEVLEDVLRSLRMTLPEQSRPGVLVLATLSGDLHRLGLLTVALMTALHGFGIHVLGADTPAEEIAQTAHESGARAVVVSVSLAAGGVEADRTLAALRSTLGPDVRLVAGGAGARLPRRGVRGVEYLEDLSAYETWLTGFGRS